MAFMVFIYSSALPLGLVFTLSFCFPLHKDIYREDEKERKRKKVMNPLAPKKTGFVLGTCC
jgi:hypothetical protein